MTKANVTIGFLTMAIGLVGHAEYSITSVENVGVGQDPRPQVAKPTVEVSAVSIDKTDVRLPEKVDDVVATMTIQVFHTRATSDESVVLEVGTAVTYPAEGVSVEYTPANQRLRLPAGTSGAITATVKLQRAHLSNTREATIITTATSSHPSRGIAIVNDDPSAPNHRVEFRMRAQ
jgi:hypothetical protein